MSDNMARTAFFVCCEPRSMRWQLGPLPPAVGQIVLLGWYRKPSSPDAGVPSAVAIVLARALSAAALVSFLCSNPGDSFSGNVDPVAAHRITTLGPYGIVGRVRAAVGCLPNPMLLLSTRRPETLLQLFGDAKSPWWRKVRLRCCHQRTPLLRLYRTAP